MTLPASSSIQMASRPDRDIGSHDREECLGLLSEPLGRHRPSRALDQERTDPRAVGEPDRPLHLLLQLMEQDLLPIAGDGREPVVDLVAQDGTGRDVGGADQQGRVERDQHAHEQRQLPDDRSPEERTRIGDIRGDHRLGLGTHLGELGAVVDRGHRRGDSLGVCLGSQRQRRYRIISRRRQRWELGDPQVGAAIRDERQFLQRLRARDGTRWRRRGGASFQAPARQRDGP